MIFFRNRIFACSPFFILVNLYILILLLLMKAPFGIFLEVNRMIISSSRPTHTKVVVRSLFREYS